MYHVEGPGVNRGNRVADRYLERMTLKVVTYGFQGAKFSNEQNIKITHAPSKRIII